MSRTFGDFESWWKSPLPEIGAERVADLEDRALSALGQVVEVAASSSNSRRCLTTRSVDAAVATVVNVSNDAAHTVVMEARRRIRFETCHVVVAFWSSSSSSLLKISHQSKHSPGALACGRARDDDYATMPNFVQVTALLEPHEPMAPL